MFYNRNLQIIYSNYETTINDDQGNVYNIQDSFKLNLIDEIISSKKINIIDAKNNIYFFCMFIFYFNSFE